MPQDQLSAEDLNALREVHTHLVDAKDPRASKVGAYLMTQIGNDPSLLSAHGSEVIPSAPISPMEQTKEGFLGPLGDALMRGPDALMKFATGHPRTEMDSHFADLTKQSGNAFRAGDPAGGISKGVAAFLPGQGDEALAAGNAFGDSDVGGGIAHSILALAPALAPAVSSARLPTNLVPGIKGGIKGGAEAFVGAKSTVPAAAGAVIGHHIGGPVGAEIGASLGAMPATIQGVVKGVRDATTPTPPAAPVAPEPFRINPVVARRGKFTPSPIQTGMPTSIPSVTPRPGLGVEGPLTPQPAVQPPPTVPGGPSPYDLSGKLPKFTQAPQESGMPSGTGPTPRKITPIEGSLVPQAAQTTMPGGPSPYDLSGKLPKYTPSATKTGMPSGGGPRTIRPVGQAVQAPSEEAPVSSTTPAGSTVIPPIAGKPARYGDMVQTGGKVLADYGTGVDSQIAQHLKSKGIKPEAIWNMDEDTLYNMSKSGVPNLRKFGTSGKASRPFSVRQKDIFNALSDAWGR